MRGSGCERSNVEFSSQVLSDVGQCRKKNGEHRRIREVFEVLEKEYFQQERTTV